MAHSADPSVSRQGMFRAVVYFSPDGGTADKALALYSAATSLERAEAVGEALGNRSIGNARFHGWDIEKRIYGDWCPYRPIEPTEFDEAECGGAFDGFTVTSDADPGL